MIVLVTGAAGFIGRNLVLKLLDDGDTVIGIDRVQSGAEAGAHPHFVEAVCDTNDAAALEVLFQRHQPEVVVALAEGLQGPIEGVVAHSAAVQDVLLKAALAASVKRVCLASTLSVYLGLEGPFHEDAPLPIQTTLHIAAMKQVSEIVGRWYGEKTPLEVVVLRFANIYGPRYHSMMNTPSRYLFAALCREAAQGKPPLDVDLYRQLADFCHVEDCCGGISLVVHAPHLQHRTYNIGAGRGVTDLDIRRAVLRAVDRNDFEDAAETNNNYLDISRMTAELGYRPKHDIDSGIRAYREWLDHHPQ